MIPVMYRALHWFLLAAMLAFLGGCTTVYVDGKAPPDSPATPCTPLAP